MLQYTPDGSGTIITTSTNNRGDNSGGSLFQVNGMDEGQLLGADWHGSSSGLDGPGAPFRVSQGSNFFFQGTGLPDGAPFGQNGILLDLQGQNVSASGSEMDQEYTGTYIPGLQL